MSRQVLVNGHGGPLLRYLRWRLFIAHLFVCIAHDLSLFLLCIAHPVHEVLSQPLLPPDIHPSIAIKHAAALHVLIQSQLMDIRIICNIGPAAGILRLGFSQPSQTSANVEVGRGRHRGEFIYQVIDLLNAELMGPVVLLIYIME